MSGQAANAAPLLVSEAPAGKDFAWSRAKQIYLRGQLNIAQGKLRDAEAILAEAGRTAESVGAQDVALDAEALRGQALDRLGRSQEADATLNAVIERARRGKDRYREAVALVNLGFSRQVRSRYDEALPYFERVLAFSDLSPQLVYARALINAGTCYLRIGEFKHAIDAQQRAVAAHEHRGNPLYLEQALGSLGESYVYDSRPTEGIAYLERALALAKAQGLKSDAAIWAGSLASTHLDLGHWDEAERLNNDARQLNVDRRTAPYLLLNAARIAAGRDRSADAVSAYREALDVGRDDPAVQWQAQAGLGRLEATAGHPDAAARYYEAALTVIEQTQSGLLKTDYKLSLLPRLLSWYGNFVDLLVDQRQYDRALAIADSSRGRVLAERHGTKTPGPVTSVSLRRAAALTKGTLLFYWFGPERSYAWIVSDQRIDFVPLKTTAEHVDELVRSYQDFLIRSNGDPLKSASAGDELYATLVAPVTKVLPRDSRLVVVPDATLTRLNLDTLPVKTDRPHYLVEDFEIAIAPSLASLTSDRETSQPRDRSVLLIGDAVPVESAYPALRFASTEMDAVAAAFDGRVSMYRGADASPARYRDAKPDRFDVVHFTAHAAANAESPLDSAVILSRDPSGYKLYARDVAAQPLSADLVTISACRSAGERTYGGEGLVGFAWAFLRAGAKRVVAGLWDVDDRSTADLMRDMYAGLAKGQTPGASLRAAKLAMIVRGGALAKPYYWGPFQLFVGSTAVP